MAIKSSFSLMARPLPLPPLLMARPLREKLFFAASLLEVVKNWLFRGHVPFPLIGVGGGGGLLLFSLTPKLIKRTDFIKIWLATTMAIEIWARARNERPDPACHAMTAGPSSLEDYFQKGALLGQKVALNFGTSIQGQIHKKMFPSIWRSVISGL